MKFKFLLPLICITSLVGCTSNSEGESSKGLVKDGVEFNETTVRDSVPEQVQHQMEQSVVGVVISGTTKMSESFDFNGQKSSASATYSVKEEYDFINKKATFTQKAGGQSISYTLEIVGDDVHITSEYYTEDTLKQMGIDTTLSGLGAMFDMQFNQCFSFRFMPSSKDLEQMKQAFGQYGETAGAEDVMTSIINQMVSHFVMAGDFEHGNAEFGISEPFSISMNVSGSAVNLTYNKLRVVYKDFLCTESVNSITETVAGTYGSDDYSYYINMKITSSSSLTYKYIFAE